MARILGLAILLTLIAPAPQTVAAVSHSCSSGVSTSTPPSHILVFRSHKRGSGTPARVERWSFRKYVTAVMASGAWPGRVRESAKVGSIAIKQYAWWMIMHTCRSFRGKHYAITDSEQYLERSRHPADHVPVRTLSAVTAVWGVSLRKGGRFFRTGWSGGTYDDGWHLGEDAVRHAAQAGHGWRWIIHRYLDPVRIVE